MSYNTITLKGDPIKHEATADAGDIYPGYLCELTATGVKKHATLAGNAYPMFALEDDHQGNDVTDVYTISNVVSLGVFPPGSEVYALLADGENATAFTSFLESHGDGELQVIDTDASVGLVKTNSIVAVALESLDLSGSLGTTLASRRIKVMIV
jgi:hypothetical protein